MKTITPLELVKLINEHVSFQLIDVREFYEHEDFNIGGSLIPLGEVTQYIDQIEKEIPVILYCQKGVRSHIAIQRLENKFPFENLYNLIGGMDEWRKKITY
jgi:rhodanese-related sulfurtransferase